MSPPPTRLVCAGCGATVDPAALTAVSPPTAATLSVSFRCARAAPGDDIDHVIARVLDAGALAFPHADDLIPFLRYRTLFHSYHVALGAGMSDDEYVDLVRRLDDAVGEVDGRGFRVTPFVLSVDLGERLGLSRAGGVWVKDETGNVSGSHKARHLMGIMIFLQVLERLGLVPKARPDLAIASCGNAALAAAVVARAAGWRLRVFIPVDADPVVVTRLRSLGAGLTVCPREPGVAGDPCYHRFRDALRGGALPFCCQGPDNGLTIEGGETLAWEMIDALGDARLDRALVQVGGGALASACIQAFADARRLGRIASLPRFHSIQTGGAFPLARAYDLVAERIASTLAHLDSPILQDALRHAATHRSEFMWPWEQEPRSIAHGILDDETYDWHAVVSGMLETGGSPIVVGEERLVEANALARETTGIGVDHTGSAGLAGLMELCRSGAIGRDEHVAVIFSGVRRA